MTIPEKLRRYLSLEEAYNRVGRRMFGEQWSGQEARLGSGPSHKEARATKRRRGELLAELQKRYPSKTVNDAFVKELICLNFATGFLDEDHLSDEPAAAQKAPVSSLSVGELVFELERINAEMALWPSLKELSRSQEARQRDQKARGTFFELLANGALEAYEAAQEGRKLIVPEIWGSKSVALDVLGNRAFAAGREIAQISFYAPELTRVLSTLPARTPPEEEARQSLMAMMQSRTARPRKQEVWEDYHARFSISRRAFNHIWTRAAQETRSGWNEAGRPKSALKS